VHAALCSREGMGKEAEPVAPCQSFASLVASNMLHARYKPLSFVGSEFLRSIQNIYVNIAPGEGQSKQGRGSRECWRPRTAVRCGWCQWHCRMCHMMQPMRPEFQFSSLYHFIIIYLLEPRRCSCINCCLMWKPELNVNWRCILALLLLCPCVIHAGAKGTC
jgi:hypothetical protein